MYYFAITLTIFLLAYLKIFTRVFSQFIKTKPVHILIPLATLSLGIIIQKKFCLPINYLICVGLILITIFIASLIFKKFFINLTLISVLPLLFGAILLHKQEYEYKSKMKFAPIKNVNIIGKVLEKEEKEPYAEVLKIELKKIFRNSSFKYFNDSEKIILYSKAPTKINPGDKIILRQSHLSIPHQNFALNGNPSFRDYIIKENIVATSFNNNPLYEITNTKRSSFFLELIKLKNYFYQKLKSKFSEKTFSYFSPIFLGNKNSNLNQQEKNSFMFWGISHYLARSGLHIAIFILIWEFIFSMIPFYFLIKQILFAIICIAYAAMSWSSISFLRAFTIFLLYKIGKILNKQTNLLYILSTTCMIYLCINPYLIFFLDFQLSFGLTISIAASFSK